MLCSGSTSFSKHANVLNDGQTVGDSLPCYGIAAKPVKYVLNNRQTIAASFPALFLRPNPQMQFRVIAIAGSRSGGCARLRVWNLIN